MTAAQMIVKVKFWLDHYNSPRFNDTNIYSALNSAQDQIVLDRYNNFKQKKVYSFESVERVRAELYTIVRKEEALSVTGDLLTKATLDGLGDYRFALLVRPQISKVYYNAKYLTIDELEVKDNNPYTKPNISKVYKNVYYTQYDEGLEFHYGSTGLIDSVDLYYLAKQTDIGAGSDSELPETLHEEIVKVAAQILSGTVDDFNKEKDLFGRENLS